jgi:hypothetical protein
MQRQVSRCLPHWFVLSCIKATVRVTEHAAVLVSFLSGTRRARVLRVGERSWRPGRYNAVYLAFQTVVLPLRSADTLIVYCTLLITFVISVFFATLTARARSPHHSQG